MRWFHWIGGLVPLCPWFTTEHSTLHLIKFLLFPIQMLATIIVAAIFVGFNSSDRTFSVRTLRGTHTQWRIFFYEHTIYCLIGDNFGWFIHSEKENVCVSTVQSNWRQNNTNFNRSVERERLGMEEEGNKGLCSFFFLDSQRCGEWDRTKQHWLCFGFVSHRSYYRAICQIVHPFSISQIVYWIVLHAMSKIPPPPSLAPSPPPTAAATENIAFHICDGAKIMRRYLSYK